MFLILTIWYRRMLWYRHHLPPIYLYGLMLFLLHTISSFQIQIFYWSLELVNGNCPEGMRFPRVQIWVRDFCSCCSSSCCYHVNLRSTPRFGLGWDNIFSSKNIWENNPSVPECDHTNITNTKTVIISNVHWTKANIKLLNSFHNANYK